MIIRRAQEHDIDGILELLVQVCMVHHNGRPDLFNGPATKYSREELSQLIKDDARPIFVAVDESAEGDGSGKVLGHAFCIFEQIVGDAVRTDVKTLYVDDICIDENARGRHIGTAIYQYVEDFARKSGCYNLTLNVWSCNPGAQRFYEACGLMPQKVGMEKIL